ncbi:MAG: alpha/beta fold hydrolase [Rhizobiales bacterium]|nr:alpha/beta fold hydrolase [Hyphomicrobiales bacterium]
MLPHYQFTDGPSGPLVLFIHPLGADLRFWDDTRALLSGAFSTVALDLPGSGQSKLPVEPLTTDGFLEAIDDVRRDIGAEKIILVGCAVGAMIPTRYAAQKPQNVAGLLMSNPGIRITPAASENLATRAETVLQDGLSSLVPGVIDNAFKGQNDGVRKAAYQAMFLAQDAEGYARSAQAVCNMDIASDLPNVRCPVCLVRGDLDMLFPEAHSAEIRTLIPAATLHSFAHGAHFIPYQLPNDFAVVLQEFVEGLPPES